MPPTPDPADVLVLLELGPGATGQVAGTLDRRTGVLTPTRRTTRTRPVVVDRRAHVLLVAHRRGVDLSVERWRGVRRAVVPLVRVHERHEASQSAELFAELAVELDRRNPRDVPRTVVMLRDQARWLADGHSVRTSPLTTVPRGSVLDLVGFPVDW
ncbi:hypothetical protein [Cellulomonas sp.]|uniref:hypothetical protein n=1 Tax=Cellulomonas sp. TaxID=40001 RepID=UPI0028125D72|nr:hypothetical protein [Cellulomonas sp.]